MEANTVARQKYGNDVREEMRRSLTRKDRPSTGIVRHLACKEGTHLGNIVSRNLLKNPEYKFAFFRVCMRYSVTIGYKKTPMKYWSKRIDQFNFD